MYRQLVIIALIVLQDIAFSEGHYTIVASKNIRPNSDYHVSVSLHDNPAPCNIVISISNDGDYKRSQDVTIQPFSTQLLQFITGDMPPEPYRITAEGIKGLIFRNETLINLHLKNTTVLVQTDKAIYKPGDMIRFRVLILDSNMRPSAIRGAVKVWIADGNNNRIKQWVDAQVNRGVFEGELQLSDQIVFGDWKVVTEVNGNTESKKFIVAEYVLPKFDVTIDTAKHQVYKDEKLRAVIRSKYTFGKAVKGEATISVFPKIYGSFQPLISNLITRKVIKMDGKGTVEFDIKEELNFNENYEQTIQIEAVVEEELTGRKQNTTYEVTLHKSKYRIELGKSAPHYKPGLPFVVTLAVLTHEGAPIQDKTNPVIVRTSYDSSDNVTETKLFLNDNGTVRFTTVPERRNGFSLTAYYLDAEESLGFLPRAESQGGAYLQVSLKTEKPTINNEVSVEVQSTENMRFFTYEILGRGDIIVSNTIEVPNRNSFQFQFFASFAMFPKAQLIVHYIKDNEILSDRLEINFGKQIQNEVKIDLSVQRIAPSQDIDITISSKPNSFIGLLGVDQSVLLLKGGNDLDTADVLGELDQYSQNYYPPEPLQRGKRFSYPYVETWMDFDGAGTILLTNAVPEIKKLVSTTATPYDNEIQHGVITTIKKTDIGPAHVLKTNTRPPLAGPYAFSRIPKPYRNRPRVHLSQAIRDTWLFVNFTTGVDGRQNIRKKLPDTITSWVITGFSMDPVNGLGLTKQPRTIQTFKPFFVSLDLPYSVKRGEVLTVSIVVFNYLNRDLDTDVTIHNEEQDFDFVEMNNEVGDNPKIELYRRKRISVTSNEAATTSFMIRPKKVGRTTIKVTAASSSAGDSIERVLPVEPEGTPLFFNKAVFIDLREKSNHDSNFTIDIPKNAVPDSTYIEVAALGDIMGGAVKNLNTLVRMPRGCGEQNMLNFVPNIVILDYLKATNQLSSETESQAKSFMDAGYQRELSYRRSDGSFSAFGENDKNGSTWLTAFVARSFRQAAKHIDVEERLIEDALAWLSKVQAPNGSFPEVGVVSHADMQGGAGQGVALTAYVLTAFVENKEKVSIYRNVINKAMDFVARNLVSSDDVYTLAVASYALQLAQHNSKDYILQTFDSRAMNKDGLKWWERPIPKSDEKNTWYQQPNSINIEMAAYGLLAFIEAGHYNDGLPILKWLLSQRNDHGGFTSTQDTVVGLQALASYAEKIVGPSNNVQIRVKFNEGTESRINVNQDNGLVLQKYELPKSVRQINITATGRGFALLQLSYKYNTNVTGAWPRFSLDPQLNKNSNPDYLHLTVCTNFVPAGGVNESNMAVMEVNFPSGFTADLDTLPSLEVSEHVKKVETKNADTTVIVYFDSLGFKEVCPTLDAFRTHKVAKQRPSDVIIYDYYDNSRRARQFYYAPKTTLCDICEGSECDNSCAIQASKQRASKSAFDDDDNSAIKPNSASNLNGTLITTIILLGAKYLFQ